MLNATNQKLIESLESRFINHLRNPKGVNITNDGLLGVDFVNKRVDVPLFTDICQVILLPLYRDRFDVIVAPETSGFYFAPIVASTIKASFVPIRKGSRVPKTWDKYISSNNTVVSATKGQCENFIIPEGSIEPGSRVLLVDDFIMTGNAIFGGINVISKAGGKVVEILAIIDKYYDGGRKKVEIAGHIVRSLLSINNFEVLDGSTARLFIREFLFRRYDPRNKFVDVALRNY
jgi:adenine/guanine phosphoribosyltransferase-like PRPP-binding protein